MQTIDVIAKKLEIKEYEKYGEYKAKIKEFPPNKKGKLILVTATNPTPFGEGKTTISIGLLDALCALGYKATASLREPSLGPVFGLKGGATGGGLSKIIPEEEINLHFTGDFAAIETANNLLCAAIDNHIYQGNELNIDENKIMFNRCIDMNDRALKKIHITSSYEREEHFDITAASEIMAILCLSNSMSDLKERLDRILIAYSKENMPIFASSLHITGALLAILKDAIKPNLVQTLEENPVLVHGGPFANIAHGSSSILATKAGLAISDFCITEAGFGSDLGALKFYDIVARKNDLTPDAIVLVTTIKALKYNGNDSLEDGIINLKAHLDILSHLHIPVTVCLNQFTEDKENEIVFVKEFTLKNNARFSTSTSYKEGSKGATNLAKEVLSSIKETQYQELYSLEDSLETKINRIVKDIYQAKTIEYTEKALRKMNSLKENNLDRLPICIAKTQYSITDTKEKLGYPAYFIITIKDIKLYNGAGFITIYLGNILTMPGLPKKPNYETIDVIDDKIIGMN